jgi:hypothetical protein
VTPLLFSGEEGEYGEFPHEIDWILMFLIQCSSFSFRRGKEAFYGDIKFFLYSRKKS